MAVKDPLTWTGRWSRWRQLSIFVKIGAMFVVLSLIFASFLLSTSNLTKQLFGMSKGIEQAGTERMRVYKLGALIPQYNSSSERERESIRKEMSQFERVLEGLRIGTSQYVPVAAISPNLSAQLRDLEERWFVQLKPSLHLALKDSGNPATVKNYVTQADGFVAAWDRMVEAMEQDLDRRLQSLHYRQTWSLFVFFGLMGAALIFLDLVVREPLKRLTASAERLAAGELKTEIQVLANDELGQLACTFKRLAETIRQKIGELNALHATGQEIGILGPGGLEDVLRRIADRASESLEADLAVVMVRHVSMECWVVEAASGTEFDRIRKQILLFEETPFSYQAFETKRPVVVDDLFSYKKELPVRFRTEFGAKSFLAVPLLGPHDRPGVLVLLSIARPRTFSEWDVQMAQQFASYAAVTMENAHLFDAVESESQHLRAQLDEVERKVAELTHEVKAPAGRVAEFASWIERDYGGQLDAKGLQYLAWIKNEGKDLASLAERTLNLARINHQTSPLERVDVDSVVRDVLALLEKDCLAKGVCVTIEPDLPNLACRRIHVKQIFENLIGNAIKYMGDQPHPHVEVGSCEDQRGLLVYVRDNGMGIEPAMIDRIFLPFVRLATDAITGAGIGLSIVKTVVEQYEGEVSADSMPGVGSTFYVRLPVIKWNPAFPREAVRTGMTPAGNGQTGHQIHTFAGNEEPST